MNNLIKEKYSNEEKEYILSRFSSATGKEIAKECNERFWNGKAIRNSDNILSFMSYWRKKERNATDFEKMSDEEKGSIASNQLLLRENQTLKDSLIKSKIINDLIVDTVNTSLSKLPPPKIQPPKRTKNKKFNEEVALLEFSDWHPGERTLLKDTSGINTFDFPLFTKRAEILTNSTIECTDIIRSRVPINKLVINMMGDLVTGENLFIGQSRSIDKILVDQVFDGAAVYAEKVLIPLAQVFPKIDVYCVWGNHGRIGKKGEYHQRTNWDYVLYRYLSERLKNIKNITFHISESNALLYRIPEIPEYTHLVVHGDQIKSAATPFYGLEKLSVKYVQLFNVPIHYTHCGHFHRPAQIDMPHGELIMNGSAVGADDFTVNFMQTGNHPKQLLMGFNRKHGKTWSFELKLGSLKEMAPDARGIFTPVNEESYNRK